MGDDGQGRKVGRVLVALGALALVVVTVVAVVDLVRTARDFVTGEDNRKSARETARRIGEVWATGDLDNRAATTSIGCEEGSGEPGLSLIYPKVDGTRAHELLGAELRRRGWTEARMPYGYRYQKNFGDWSALVAVYLAPFTAPLDASLTVGGNMGDDCATFRHEVGKLLRAQPPR